MLLAHFKLHYFFYGVLQVTGFKSCVEQCRKVQCAVTFQTKSPAANNENICLLMLKPSHTAFVFI